jgi:hypothetical protein
MIEHSQSLSDEHFKIVKVMALKALSSLLLGAYRARCQRQQRVIKSVRRLLSLGERDEGIVGEGLCDM